MEIMAATSSVVSLRPYTLQEDYCLNIFHCQFVLFVLSSNSLIFLAGFIISLIFNKPKKNKIHILFFFFIADNFQVFRTELN